MIVGNDISEFQGQIDWDTYAKNSNFVIIRATYGNGYIDKQFFRNRDESRRVGLPRGFYHYCYPQYNTPEAEADWFLSQMNLQAGESLYLDYEEKYTGDAVAWCKVFLDRISGHLNGYKGLIYLNQSHMALNWQTVVEAGYGLWLASYQADGTGNVGQWKFMAIQQTSSSQIVPGIIGNVDRDVFFGDTNAFLAYGYKTPSPSPFPIPPTTTNPIPPTGNNPTTSPPSTIPPTVSTDYKQIVTDIEGVLHETGPLWTFFFQDPRMGKIKKIIDEETKV